ncbi:lipopolysaccharide biosynthesis protein [Methylobacterium dankookense]|uniref:Polysaccharide biosynthesis protein C-terminal domain-containing protein n=1 Tax=Methylobacterium dankookense TaxID=560405 RepID=A0A564FZ92_9HYPH|nr:oligosaccharide flippase family protein [Methylobacterium dankookense]GJD54315.1 hypothetical protein IFDJLNFL_0185 [Methylobacterium dankookense]VUF13010.1 hypothetical protein MTDSW087_02707 [Methylobacterium dankookense]
MLLSRTLLYLPAQLIGPLAQFAAVVVWTHLMPPAAYGTVALILAMQELVFQLCLAWWSSYVLRYAAAAASPEEKQRQGAHENAVLLGSASLQLAVTVALLAIGDSPLTPGLVAAAVGYTISRSLTMHMAERARSAQAIGLYTAAQTVGPVLGLGIAIGFVVWTPTAAAALAGFALAQIVVLPVLWLAVVPSRAISLDRAVLRRAFFFSAPLLAAGAVGWFTVNGIRVIVEQFEGAAAVGLLSVGWGLGQRLMSVAAMLVTAAAFPIAVERMERFGPEAAYAQVSRNSLLLLAILVPSTVGVIWLTPPLVDLLIGAEFREATRVLLPIATVAAAVRNLRVHCVDQVFLLLGRTGFLLGVNLAEAAATLAGCAAGLAWGGLPGACLGCLAGSALGFVICFAGAWRQGLRFTLLPLLKIAAATALMVGALALAPHLQGQLGAKLRLALTIAGSGGLYLAALALLFREYWPKLRRAA